MEEKEKKRRGRPRKVTGWTAALLHDRSREYFDKCDSRKKAVTTNDGVIDVDNPAPYTLHGLCSYLDITTATFRNWRAGKGCTTELAAKAQMIHQKLTDNRITGALDGTQNSSFAKFLMTNDNADEYKEKVEVESTVGETVKSILEMAVGSWTNNMKN